MRTVAALSLLAFLGNAGLTYAQTATETPAENAAPTDDAAEENADERPIRAIDPNTLIATDEEKAAAAKAKADAERAAMIAELDKQLLGSWGRISSRGAAGISDANIITGANQCLRARRISAPEYAEDADKVLPEETQRRGNIVFYRTKKGLQRLDTALRRVFLISSIEQRPKIDNQPPVWKLGTTKGSVLLGFGTVRRKGRRFPVMIEQNAVYVRCTAPKADG